MKVTYYSELLKKSFDSEDECLAAEAEYENVLAEKKEKENSLSKMKKESANEIKEADDRLKLALAELKKTRIEANKIVVDARKKAEEIIKEAEQKALDAYNDKYKAVSNFNEKFGTYTKTYTGKEAIDELNNAINSMFSFWF